MTSSSSSTFVSSASSYSLAVYSLYKCQHLVPLLDSSWERNGMFCANELTLVTTTPASCWWARSSLQSCCFFSQQLGCISSSSFSSDCCSSVFSLQWDWHLLQLIMSPYSAGECFSQNSTILQSQLWSLHTAAVYKDRQTGQMWRCSGTEGNTLWDKLKLLSCCTPPAKCYKMCVHPVTPCLNIPCSSSLQGYGHCKLSITWCIALVNSLCCAIHPLMCTTEGIPTPSYVSATWTWKLSYHSSHL